MYGVHNFNLEGKGISLGLENSHQSLRRADQVDLWASKLLVIKMQAASTHVGQISKWEGRSNTTSYWVFLEGEPGNGKEWLVTYYTLPLYAETPELTTPAMVQCTVG